MSAAPSTHAPASDAHALPQGGEEHDGQHDDGLFDTNVVIDEHGTAHHAPGPELIMLFLFLSLLIGVATKKFLTVLKKNTGLRIPYSVVLLVIGGILGAIAYSVDVQGAKGNQATQSLSSWLAIAKVPTLILFIFLPALITEATMTTDFFVFTNHLPGHILLAGPGMIIQVILIAITGKYMFAYGWGWTESFLFGGIMSATDPVAVIALLKELGVLPDLRVLVEGESVFNDGTAIIVFELCKAIIVSPHTPVEDHVWKGLRLVLGAPILGTIFFFISRFWLRRTHDAFEETIITVCSGYLCYYIAEATPVHTSGVLAIATQGLLMAGYGMQAFTREGEHVSHAFWGILCFCSDTIIFLLAGAIIINKAFTIEFTGRDWGMLFALYGMLTLIRGFMVTICTPYLRYWGYGLTPQTMTLRNFVKNMFVVVWGGLRGAVGLVLALAVAANHDLGLNVAPGFQDKCLMMTGGIVFMTSMLNAVTLEGMIKGMGLGLASEAEEKEFAAAQKHIQKVSHSMIEELQAAKPYARAHWATLSKRTDLGGHDTMAQVIMKATGVNHIVDGVEKALEAVHLKKAADTEELIEGETEANGASAPQMALTELEKEIAADKTKKMKEDANHVRFLLFLKTNYNHQREHGMLKEGPYRALIWTVNKALVEMTDISSKSDPDSLLCFDWGWLEKQNLFKLNHYQEWIYNVSPLATGNELSLVGMMTNTLSKPHKMLSQFLLPLIVSRIKEQFQIVLAVIAAHREAQEQEFAYDESVLAVSAQILHLAEEKLAQMTEKYGHIRMECSTEAATSVILFRVEEEIEHMFSVGKINQRELETLKEQLEKCYEDADNMRLPFPQPLSAQVHNVPYINLLPEAQFEQIWEDANILPAVFEPYDVIVTEGDPCDGLWLVINGTVFLSNKDSHKDEGRHVGHGAAVAKAPSGVKDAPEPQVESPPQGSMALMEEEGVEEGVEEVEECGEKEENCPGPGSEGEGGHVTAPDGEMPSRARKGVKKDKKKKAKEEEKKEELDKEAVHTDEVAVVLPSQGDGVLVQGGGIIGQLEVMSKLEGKACHYRDTCTAVTKVTAAKIPAAFLSQIIAACPKVQDRMWQLHGTLYVEKIGPSDRVLTQASSFKSKGGHH
mmetsp:Transcript_58801/g.144119  ORF Transcript_58801/g.144119 Transcript_58801/m.144119 type:complete len:1126 (+) Transcript_58801:508-3885(+)